MGTAHDRPPFVLFERAFLMRWFSAPVILCALAAAGCAQGGATFAPPAASNARHVDQVTPQTATTSVLYRFKGGSTPAGPAGGLTAYGGMLFGSATQQGTDGIVYAATQSGASWTLKRIYAFTNSADGSAPYGLVANAKGVLLG